MGERDLLGRPATTKVTDVKVVSPGDEILKELAETQSRNFAAARDQEKVDAGYASVLYQRLLDQIATFEDTLSDEEELGGRLASFGTSVLIRIESVTFSDPFFIIFSGSKDGEPDKRLRLVQHCSQINVLFTAIKKADSEQPPKRIGFHPEPQSDEEE